MHDWLDSLLFVVTNRGHGLTSVELSAPALHETATCSYTA